MMPQSPLNIEDLLARGQRLNNWLSESRPEEYILSDAVLIALEPIHDLRSRSVRAVADIQYIRGRHQVLT